MRNIKTLLILGTGTLILLIIGLYNGFPLVYSDTGTYIYSGFDKFIPNDRPITYGLFLRFFSFNYSLWLVILVQNFLTSFVIYETLKIFKIKNLNFVLLFIGILTFLMLFTGISWYSNQIMPDFFTPLIILLICLLVLGENQSLFKKIIFSIILIYSLTTHFSNLLIGISLIMLLIILKFVFKDYLKTHFFSIKLKNLLFTLLVILAGWLTLPLINFLVEKKFVMSKAPHVFIMGHLDDTGILKKFLDENCSNDEYKNCKLCQYKDSLPIDIASFVWGSDMVKNSGGWQDSKNEYNKIIKATLIHPKYLLMNITKSFNYGLVQLTKNEIGQGLSANNEGSAPYGQIHWRFHDELNNYLNSRQNKWNGVNLKLDSINYIHMILLILSLFVIIFIFTTSLWSKLEPLTLIFLVIIILSIILNSFVTAGLVSPCERYQARVVWLVPFVLIILIMKNFEAIIKTFKK